jgi:Tfp pilus assembly protein FimV
LRKEADNLDRFKEALVSFYSSKFNLAVKDIEKLMDEETWMLGEQSQIYGLVCEILPSSEPLRVSARLKNMPRYRNIPINLKRIMEGNVMSNDEKTKTQQEEKDVGSIEECVKTITIEEADRRVQGMQSAMGKQIDSLKKDYEAKVEDLKFQLKAKEEELKEAQARFIDLNTNLEYLAGELQKSASALETKTKALETLNASVNTPAEELPTMQEGLSKCKTPTERVAFLSSGKYTK